MSESGNSKTILGIPLPGIIAAGKIAFYVGKTIKDVKDIVENKADIPFNEIKDIMDKRFNNLDKAMDRNFAVLQDVSRMMSKTLTTIELIRIEMYPGFNRVLESIKNSRIEPVLSRLNNFIRYFDNEKDQINSFTKDEFINTIEDLNDVLSYLKDSRTPKGDSLYTLVNDIINQKFAIPSDPEDKLALSALYALYYGTQTYGSVLFFLIEQHSYLADYYYQNGELEMFNSHFGMIQTVLDDFRTTLAGSTNENALIDKVINVIREVQGKDFIADDRALTEMLTERIDELSKLKVKILEMNLPIITDVPAKFTGRLKYKSPGISTPLGDWRDDAQVSYAMQYKNGNHYSQVGDWSEPFMVNGDANPVLTIPTDPKRRTRLIFRKFNEDEPELVGIIENKYQTEFRDINRDLYNAASWLDDELAENVINTLIANGANSTEIFDEGRRAVHSAADGGQESIAIKLLKHTHVDVRDDNGFTALHIASDIGHDDLIKLLVAQRADVNAKTYRDELTPLHLAAIKGYEPTVISLMECKGIDVNQGDDEGFTPLHSAITGGLPVVQALLKNKSVDINAKSNRGFTPLHLVAAGSYLDIAEELTAHNNLNINIQDQNEKLTPLHFASIAGHLDMIKFLAGKGANMNVRSETNWTPLHYAVSLRKENVALELLKGRTIEFNPKTVDNLTPLHLASDSGQVKIVQKLLGNRSMLQDMLNTKTKDGLTALHIATLNKNKEIVSILLNQGADIEAKTNQGITPLLAAAAIGNLDLVKFLLRNNADMNVVDANDKNVLHLAAESGHLDIVKHFVEDRGFSLKNGDSVMLSAIARGHLKIIKYLVDDKRVDPTCYSLAVPSCPLSVASKYGNVDIVRYLVSKHKVIDLSGVPIQNAARYGHLNLVKYIIEEKGGDPNRYENGNTPMHLAAKYGWLSIVKYLHEKLQIALDIDRDHYKKSTVQLAITSGNLYLVKYLMENIIGTSSLIDPEYQKSPLHFAIHGADLESLNDKQSSSVLRYLVDEKHYDVNAQCKYGYTPLHDAVNYESFYAIKFLISRGADIHKRSTSHETPLDLAIKYKKSVKIQEFLQMQDVCNTILENKVPEINQGFNVNVKCVDVAKQFTDDIYHTTALHLAVSTGAINTVKLLINHGVDLNIRDEQGNTPMHLAAQNGNMELLTTLIRGGANVNIQNKESQTPKDLAKEKQDMNIVEILRQAQKQQNSGGVISRVRKSINQEASLGAQSSSKSSVNVLSYIIDKECNSSSGAPLCLSSTNNNHDSIDIIDAQCLDNNLSLGLLLAQNFINKKFPLRNFLHVTSEESKASALKISQEFEMLLKKSGNIVDNLDFYQLYLDIEANIRSEKFSNVPIVLNEFAKNACGNESKAFSSLSNKISGMFEKF